jgi:hypothetical protein
VSRTPQIALHKLDITREDRQTRRPYNPDCRLFVGIHKLHVFSSHIGVRQLETFPVFLTLQFSHRLLVQDAIPHIFVNFSIILT